jgi:hypothetical protein
MGEYADMMLDGTCCCQCGEFLDSGGDGYPRLCAGCDAGRHQIRLLVSGNEKHVPCPDCKRKFATVADLHRHHSSKHGGAKCSECGKQMKSGLALQDHMRSKHPPGLSCWPPEIDP